TDWLAEADHGGFYQAVANGTYAKYGLDVEILQGGPGAQNRALLLTGKLDFYLGTQQEQLVGVEHGIPLVDVAAFYQKNAQVILAHS
ncbi:ABC transporter substrate-binding protein, partial [Achromobacter sp. SIMBA_011]|uniref:ABC transporter substrate-binding protein n=1 Tax=Achromobacter sp. SIMBA_011 TaxID=3085759 RepID=UPI00397E6F14